MAARGSLLVSCAGAAAVTTERSVVVPLYMGMCRISSVLSAPGAGAGASSPDVPCAVLVNSRGIAVGMRRYDGSARSRRPPGACARLVASSAVAWRSRTGDDGISCGVGAASSLMISDARWGMWTRPPTKPSLRETGVRCGSGSPASLVRGVLGACSSIDGCVGVLSAPSTSWCPASVRIGGKRYGACAPARGGSRCSASLSTASDVEPQYVLSLR